MTKRINAMLGNENGNVPVAVAATIVAMPLCAIAGSYIGQGLGWCLGNVIDMIPQAERVAPWLAERSGLVSDAKSAIDLNENIYQTALGTSGFWGGLLFPLDVWRRVAK